MTVQLTRQMLWEEGRRRLMEALVTVEYAGIDLEESGRQSKALARFREAQRALKRAWVASAWGMYGDDDVLEPLGMLLSALPRDRTEPGAQFELLSGKEAAEMAEQATFTLQSEEFAKPPPFRYLFTAWAYREWMYRLRHPREWRAQTHGTDRGDRRTEVEPQRSAGQNADTKRVASGDPGESDQA